MKPNNENTPFFDRSDLIVAAGCVIAALFLVGFAVYVIFNPDN